MSLWQTSKGTPTFFPGKFSEPSGDTLWTPCWDSKGTVGAGTGRGGVSAGPRLAGERARRPSVPALALSREAALWGACTERDVCLRSLVKVTVSFLSF